ncbi:hypothetical protein BP6252_07169 [Coleophoma cylindrospora]|uniref:Heterokaryon incompatibility domain-containing protein n=1 Tax=Coleophoma cylindrospora TaxID=1849047 RepID=A0A3D8RGU6_9HELO|nr:hypothetical protein BP6252_07169 [Coleophoma cylindrospora]
MNHLPVPKDPYDWPVKVPLLSLSRGDLAYDGLGLLDFPDRKGFDPESFAKGDFGSWTSDEAITLVQSWCFFGLLLESFSCIGINLGLEAFVNNDEVTTAALPSLLHKWETIGHHLEREDRVAQYKSLIGSWNCVHRFTRTISLFTNSAPHGHQHFFSEDSGIPCSCTDAADFCLECPILIADIVLLSIYLLGEYLERGFEIYEDLIDDSELQRIKVWPDSNYLKQRMLRAGWCRQEIQQLHEQGTKVASLFYLSSMNRRGLNFEHLQCDSRRCSREQLNHKTYKTRHSPNCSDAGRTSKCKQLNFDPLVDQRISYIIYQHMTPVITVSLIPNSHKLQLTIRAVQKPLQVRGARFLDSIMQRSAKFVVGDRETRQACPLTYVCISHVWSDGMGNLKLNGLPRCQLMRIQSIVNALYPKMVWPVPFWIDTICVPRKYPARSIAIMAMRDIYKNADKVLVMDSVLMQAPQNAEATEIVMRLRGSTWATRLWTYHEAGLAKSLHYQLNGNAVTSKDLWTRHKQEHPYDKDVDFRLSEELSATKEPKQDNSIAVQLDKTDNHSLELNCTRAEERLDVSFRDGIQFVQAIEFFNIPNAEEHSRLAYVLGPLRYRRTSYLKDETICLAGLLGYKVDDDINLTTSDRMKRLLLTFKSVPRDILFADLPRLQEDGYRWMPSTFLGQGNKVTMVDDRKATPSQSGLCTTLPGIFFKVENNHFKDIDHHIRVEIDDQICMLWDQPQPGFDWNNYSNKRVAVVLQHDLEWDGMTKGVLVTLKELYDDVQLCRMECLVLLSKSAALIEAAAEADNILRSRIKVHEVEYKVLQSWCIG